MSTPAANHKVARRRLRRKLEARGLPQAEIDATVAALQERQAVRRVNARSLPSPGRYVGKTKVIPGYDDATRQRIQDETYARLAVDDRRYRPGGADPLTVGAARVSGLTAKAARRTKALTKWEWEERQ